MSYRFSDVAYSEPYRNAILNGEELMSYRFSDVTYSEPYRDAILNGEEPLYWIFLRGNRHEYRKKNSEIFTDSMCGSGLRICAFLHTGKKGGGRRTYTYGFSNTDASLFGTYGNLYGTGNLR